MSQAIASVDKQYPRSRSSLMTHHRRSYHLAIRVNEPQEGVWACPHQMLVSLYRFSKYKCQSPKPKEGTRHKTYTVHTPTHIGFTLCKKLIACAKFPTKTRHTSTHLQNFKVRTTWSQLGIHLRHTNSTLGLFQHDLL